MQRTVNWKGKRKLGVFVQQDNGVTLYVALKGHADLGRAKNLTLSESKRRGESGWGVDIPTLMKAQRLGCKYVVVKLRKKRHYWVTRIENFQDPKRAKLVTRGKTMSRVLPLDCFVESMQEISL